MTTYLHGELTGQTVQDLIVSTVIGFVAFAVTFGVSLYALMRRRAKTLPPAAQPPTQPPPAQPPALEDTRVELVREARKELANDPPPPAPIPDADVADVVLDLQRRANSGRAINRRKPGQD